MHDWLGKKVSVHDRLGGRTMLRDPAGRRVPAHDRLEQIADDRVQDDQLMRRDLEREPDGTNQSQWCPGGLTRSQKRHVQRLRQLEIIEEEQEQTLSKKGVKSQVWRIKAKADEFLEEEGKLGQGFTSADLLEEIDIGDGDRPRPTFISANLDPKYKQELKSLLKEYKDCFAWEYYEMPGLDRAIVEHRLPIKPGYRPYQQRARRCNPMILPDIKAGITWLIEANFIR